MHTLFEKPGNKNTEQTLKVLKEGLEKYFVRQAVIASLSVLVPVHQEVQIYTLSTERTGDDPDPNDISFQYRGLATHIISGPLAPQAYSCFVTAGFSLADADEYYDAPGKAVVHHGHDATWGIHDGACVGLDTNPQDGLESHLRQWFLESLRKGA